jgi:hypothetical protein
MESKVTAGGSNPHALTPTIFLIFQKKKGGKKLGSRDDGDVQLRCVTFFLANGVVSRYLRSFGSDWRDGGGAPPPVEDDGLDAVPLDSAAVAAAATDTVDDG